MQKLTRQPERNDATKQHHPHIVHSPTAIALVATEKALNEEIISKKI